MDSIPGELCAPAPERCDGGVAAVGGGIRTCRACSNHAWCAGRVFAVLGTPFGTRQLGRGDVLCRTGDANRALYVVRAGAFKTVVVMPDGREQVVGCAMPGDVIGLDAIGETRCSTDAFALTDGTVCTFATADLLGRQDPGGAVGAHLRRLMSQEIVAKRDCLAILGMTGADQRIAAYLLDLSDRHSMRRASPLRCVMDMSRSELASYLGMRQETLCRVLTRMQRLRLLRIEHHRDITLLDVDGLRALVNDDPAGRGGRRPLTDSRDDESSAARPALAAAPHQCGEPYSPG